MEFLSFGQVRFRPRVMAELGAQENTYAYIFWASLNKNFLIFQGGAKSLLQNGPRESGGVSGGVSFTAIETGSASEARHEMYMAFWKYAAGFEVGLSAGAA
jgi:hypothetical protein